MSVPSSILRYRPNLHRLKPYPSLGDYVAITICPALIMSLVGSLVMFLLEVSYAGPDAGALRWTLFWFVLAMVLVSRIAIEKGADYAALYGLALALATSFVIRMYLGSILVVWILLGVIWWCANKLVWDCTLIDDDEDASGEGLLQIAKLGPQAPPPTKEEPRRGALAPPKPRLVTRPTTAPNERTRRGPGVPPPIPIVAPPTAPKPPTAPQKRRERILARKLQWLYKNRPERNGQPHAPGLWVIYFSVAALPVFGIGQGFLRADNLAGRDFAFLLLWVYVASAFALMLTTSFLGLRRYLRQRLLRMPLAMTGTWMIMGSAIAAAVLGLCLLLPRPNAVWSITAMIDRLGAPQPQASEHALLRNGAGKGEGRPGDQATDEGQEKSAAGKTGGTQTGNAASDQKPGAQKANAPGSSAAAPASPLRTLAVLLKWIFYGIVALVVLLFVLYNFSRCLNWLKQLWRDILDFLTGRMFKRPVGAPLVRQGSAPLAAPPRPFASFQNPFLTDAAARNAPADLVLYTFNALQAWAAEHQCERRPEQTPLEFARDLSDTEPALAGAAMAVTHLYAQVAYAGKSPPPDCLPALEQLWVKMRAPRPA